MGTFVQKEGNAYPVPGGIPGGVLERIENDIAELHALRASLEHYGMAMISESSSVTDPDSGLVLSAKEKNATVEGTIAHSVSALKNKTEQISSLASSSIQFEDYGYIGVNSEKTVNVSGNAVFLFVLNNSYNQSCIWAVQTGVSGGNAKITGILTSEYFSLESNGIASVKLKTGGADGVLKSILIGWN